MLIKAVDEYCAAEKMPKLKLILGTINSLPIGLKDAEIEEIYQRDYKPFIAAVYDFPQLACTLHFSGYLLNWLDSRHSEFTDVLRDLTKRKQVEMLGGAFYDPVLPLIPRADQLDQFEKLTTWLRKKIGSRPRGGWIGEMEWEPSLASGLNSCGMDYVFLSDNHFAAAGIPAGERFQPCVTEDQGKTLVVFPLCDDWGQDIPNLEPREILEKIKTLHTAAGTGSGEKLAVILVDGRIFGCSAEGSKKWYKEKRLAEFFRLLQDSPDWLELIHPSRFLRQYPPRRRAYFPCASRPELARLSLSPDERAAYDALAKSAKSGRRAMTAGGGFFRRFLVRYPEAGDLYAKMQYVNILVSQIRGDKYRKSSAREELWKAQQGCVYWPSPCFGGIYSNALRKKAYQALISAEKITRQEGVFIPSIVTADFDLDRRTEYLYQGNEMNAYIHTLGARLFELDYLPKSWNYLDTLARGRETAEDKAADFYSRKTFIDYFFDETLGMDDFESLNFPRASFLGEAPFELVKCDRERSELVLEYTGDAPSGGRVRIIKKFIFKGAGINLYYTLTNAGTENLSLMFGCELNFSFVSKKAEDLKIFRTEEDSRVSVSPERTALKNLSELAFEDFANDTVLSFSTLEPAQVWSLPVETFCPGREGEKSIYQSSCLVPRWKLKLAPGSSWENRLNISIERRSTS
jgi:alpha-amylase